MDRTPGTPGSDKKINQDTGDDDHPPSQSTPQLRSCLTLSSPVSFPPSSRDGFLQSDDAYVQMQREQGDSLPNLLSNITSPSLLVVAACLDRQSSMWK